MASPAGEKWLDVFDTPYSNGYNTVANGFFLGLICLSLVACVAITWRKRRFIPYTFVLCVAYVFSIWTFALRIQGWSFSLFSTQYGLATITPVFVTIAIHLAAAEVIALLGATHSPFSPSAHLRTFVWTDIASLCLQSLGLSLTFTGARGAGPWGLMLPARADTGQTILFAGLLLQTLSLAASLAVLAVTYVRAAAAAPTQRPGSPFGNEKPHVYTTATTARRAALHHPRGGGGGKALLRRRAFLAAVPLAAASVLVRCAYRAAAAWGGLGSPIARDQLLWVVAEGALLTEAMVALAAFHPALCLDLNSNNDRSRDLEAGQTPLGGGGGRKRFSAATLDSQMTYATAPERGGTGMGMTGQPEEEEPVAHERSRLMFSSNVVLAPPSSDSGLSDELGSPPRRAARPLGGAALDADSYYRHENPFATPEEEEEDVRRSACDSHYFECATDTTFLSSSSSSGRDAEQEDRLETLSFVQPPRKSSKRLSRALSPPPVPTTVQHALAAEAADLMNGTSSLVPLSPPRKSSKRVSRPLPPARGLSVRSEEEDDRFEVASIMLPSRHPSKISTMHRREDLDAVSLYSQ